MGHNRHIGKMLKTEFVNSGRFAGIGILYDKYDEESGYRPQPRARGRVRLPHDTLTKEERNALNGPVITYKEDNRD